MTGLNPVLPGLSQEEQEEAVGGTTDLVLKIGGDEILDSHLEGEVEGGTIGRGRKQKETGSVQHHSSMVEDETNQDISDHLPNSETVVMETLLCIVTEYIMI